MKRLLGIDIGGTKCAVCLGNLEGDIQQRREISTTGEATGIMQALADEADGLITDVDEIAAIGIVCGGPLDLPAGRVMSPPNLPGWDNVPVVDFFNERFGVASYLQNDANAGALAEWKFGAGRGSRNMMFCTMGTGFGCGLILNGRLYAGTNGNAGELGHVRLTADGPVGYGKAGSVEGWCSGGGIAQIARERVENFSQKGGDSILCDCESLTAQSVAEAARKGDELARGIYAEVGEKLGMALSIAADLLNLETIVIGSIFARCEALIRPSMERAMAQECLSQAHEVCAVKAAGLGEHIGDIAALTVAMAGLEGTL